MATKKHTQATPTLRTRADFSPGAVVQLLFSKAGAQLADADLAHIIEWGADYTRMGAENAAQVLEGLGCLIQADPHEHAGQVGSFADADRVATVLWNAQMQMEALACMAAAVSCAAGERNVRAAGAREGADRAVR